MIIKYYYYYYYFYYYHTKPQPEFAYDGLQGKNLGMKKF